MMNIRHAKPLAELLLERKVLTPEQVQTAQADAAKSGQVLKRVIVQKGFLTEAAMTEFIARELGIPSLELGNHLIKSEVIQFVPESLARKHTLIPVFRIGDTLTVAMDDPLNFFAIDELRVRTACEIKTVAASESGIRQAIEQYYGSAGTVADVAQAIQEAALPKEDEEAAKEAPIIRLVNLLILQAVKERASDIHIEPGEETLRTRFRIDGILREVNGPPAHLHSVICSRIKVMAKLDIAEKRKPQDGRFRLRMDGHDIDIRVSTMPTQFGEKVVMRLLDSGKGLLSLEELGLDHDFRSEIERLISAPHGILLVTGPTGSGKTTTLYAALHRINAVERNIITIEDPIEYQLAGINQVQVNPKADVTFASALRSFLRQDPDVIMVGEIRDRETAEIAIQAALTGHMVFSTLHTNDASSSLTRLIEMGVEPFLIASSVVAVLAQRLVRVVCSKCKESYQAPPAIVREFHLREDAVLFRGRGCPACERSGYKGRVAIFELLVVTEAVKELIAAKAPAHVIREAARRPARPSAAEGAAEPRGVARSETGSGSSGVPSAESARRSEGMGSSMCTLREHGLAKVLAGITTIEEVLRITPSDDTGASEPS